MADNPKRKLQRLEVGDLSQALELSQSRHAQRIATLEMEGAQLGGTASSMLASGRSNRSYVSRLVPPDLSAAEYLHLTIEEDEFAAEERLALCEEKCPPRGGACAGLHEEGRGPKWRDGIVWRPCVKWRVHALDKELAAHGYPPRLVTKGFAGFDAATAELEHVLEVCRAYVEQWPELRQGGMGLRLSGDCGVGKTHLVVATARELHARRYIRDSQFWDVGHLLFVLRQHDEKSRTALDRAMETELLVLDDLNVQTATVWAADQIALIINHRWSHQAPILVTTNDDLEDQVPRLGERTVSRLRETLIGEEILGADRRVE